MVSKATLQLIAQQTTNIKKAHLISGLVVLTLVGLVLSLASNKVNASREDIPQFQLAIEMPEIDYVRAAIPHLATWHELSINGGDSLFSLLSQLKIEPTVIAELTRSRKARKILTRLKAGNTLRVQLDDSHPPRLLGLDYPVNNTSIFSMRLEDDGHYSSITQKLEYEYRSRFATGVVNNSLFESAARAGISDNIAMQLADIFGWDIDFALDIRNGDSFSVLYEDRYYRGEKIGDGSIIAAEFVNQGKTYQAVRHIDKRNRTNYYAPDGRSMRKAFLRAPLDFRRISSSFGRRYHPVHKKFKRHTGVDYAARAGTPIRATGDGKIIYRGRKGGYGKTIILRHGNKFTTLYAHMRSYARGMRPGRYIRQGQIIGYVGQTGTATGPHLHYEFRVHGRHRNPLTVRLPKARSIAKQYKEAFIASAPATLERIQLHKELKLAQATTAP
ncbi:MAG: peptidoglycan DD-metalloendopeptidase family protein [Gammaproteobacteria bacterium]|nr:peptidoglycan DD-metalloendopeptidase family protein [Gammaproteobacteria bacterium]